LKQPHRSEIPAALILIIKDPLHAPPTPTSRPTTLSPPTPLRPRPTTRNRRRSFNLFLTAARILRYSAQLHVINSALTLLTSQRPFTSLHLFPLSFYVSSFSAALYPFSLIKELETPASQLFPINLHIFPCSTEDAQLFQNPLALID
jgi:hypothetical protein